MKNFLLGTVKMAVFLTITGLLLQGFFINLIFAASANGQNLRSVTVTLKLENEPLTSFFQIVEKQTIFNFLYMKEELPQDAYVSIRAEREPLFNVLQEIAREKDLIFKRINNTIVVKKGEGNENKGPVIEDNGKITGNVVDASNNEALIGANILIRGTTLGTTTNEKGDFELGNLAPGEYTIDIRYVGYVTQSATITVVENRTVELSFQLQPSQIELADVLVTTSTVIPTPIKKLPNTIDVITLRDIERIQPTNVAELVRLKVPGAVYSDEVVGTGYSSFSVRGVSSIQGYASTMKVYVDGVEVSDPAYITYMDPSVIERVEIVPGPEASTIYGSRAISGIMQIFTKHGVKGQTKFSGKIGMKTIDNKYVSNTTPIGEQYLLNANGGFNIFDYNFQINYLNAPQWVDLFEEQSLNLSGSVRFSLNNLSGGVAINYSKLHNSSGWDPLTYKRDKELGRPLTPPNRVTNSRYRTYAVNLQYKATENWSHNLTAGYNALGRNAYDRSPNSSNQYYVLESTDRRWSAAYNTSYEAKLSEMFASAVTLGADWTEWSLPFFSGYVADRNNYEYEDQNPGVTKNYGFFGQTQISYYDFLFFTGGLRADKRPHGATEDFTWSPRLGLSYIYEVAEWMIKGRVAWGQSVIIPDADNISGYSGATYVVQANPDLLSEVQKGYELGADVYYASILSFSFTYFNQRPEDLIEMVNLGTDDQDRTLYQYQNLSEVKNEGFEIKVIAQPVDWLTVNVNFGKTVSTVGKLGPNYTGELAVGDELTGQPDYTISTNIAVTPIEGTTVTLSAFQFGHWIAADYYGFLYDLYGGTYNPSVKAYPTGYLMEYPKYTQFNVGVTQRVIHGLNAFLQIDNLANTDDFQRLNGIITQPRTITLGIQFTGFTL